MHPNEQLLIISVLSKVILYTLKQHDIVENNIQDKTLKLFTKSTNPLRCQQEKVIVFESWDIHSLNQGPPGDESFVAAFINCTWLVMNY